jgi:hypothetical protein
VKEADSESEHTASDGDDDGLDSFLTEYSGVFGQRMVEDAARSSDIRDRVGQVFRQRPTLTIHPKGVEKAARIWDPEMMALLLETQGRKAHLLNTVIQAAVANKQFGVEIMKLFQERGAPIRITRQVIVAAYGNEACGREILMQLLNNPNIPIGPRALEMIEEAFDVEVMKSLAAGRPSIRISERTLAGAARNKHGRQLLQLLLTPNREVQDAERIFVVAARNGKCGLEIIHFLIEYGLEIPANEKVWQSAAGHEKNGREILDLLLAYQGRVVDSEGVILAAAANTGSGKRIIQLLLEYSCYELVLTDAMILAATHNTRDGKEIIDLFLDHSQNDIRFTERTAPSFVETSVPEWPWVERKFALYDAVLNVLNGKHKDRVCFAAEAMVYIVSNGTRDLICGLLDKLGERVSITEEVIEAARHATIVQRLLKHTPSVQVTEKAVVLAAERLWGAEILRAFVEHSNKLPVTPEAIEAAVKDDFYSQEKLKILLENSPSVGITEKAIATVIGPGYLGSERIFDILIAECKGEIRLNLQGGTEYLVTRLLSGGHGATLVGPPIEKAVRAASPEIVAWVLKNQGKPKSLSTKAVEGAVGNSSAGKAILEVLLGHGLQMEITETVVRSAVRNYDNGHELISLLLCDGERVRVSQSGTEAIAGLLRPGTVRLLFERREGEFTITTRMIEAAARNSYDVLEAICENTVDRPLITDGVLQAAASNVNSLRWIHENYGAEVEITQKAAEIAAGHSTAALQVLLEQWGHPICITTKVMEAAATSYSVCDTVKMLFDIRHDEVCLSENFWVAVAGSHQVPEQTVDQLSEYCDCIRITEDLINAVHERGPFNKDLLSKLLCHNKVRITASGVQAIVKSFDWKTFTLMIDQHGHYIQLTDRVVEAAAENTNYGFEIVEFLIREHDESRPWCIERIIEAAARNPRAGFDIMQLLLCEFPHARFATEEVLIAAAENTDKTLGERIIELLLDERDGEAVVTNAVVEAAVANSLPESIVMELRQLVKES